MEDTNINYPVMQTVVTQISISNVDLIKNIPTMAVPNVQEDCDVQVPSDNVVIYGHHMVSYIQSE